MRNILLICLLGLSITLSGQMHVVLSSVPICDSGIGKISYVITNFPSDVELPFTIRYKKQGEQNYQFIETNDFSGNIDVDNDGLYTLWFPTSGDCIESHEIAVKKGSYFEVTGTVTNGVEGGASSPTGSVVLTVTVGSGLFSYSWKSSQNPSFVRTTKDISNLASAIYSVTVTDNTSGCTKSKVFTVNNTKCKVQNITINAFVIKDKLCPAVYPFRDPEDCRSCPKEVSLTITSGASSVVLPLKVTVTGGDNYV